MSKQEQIQKSKPAPKRDTTPSDAPTVNRKIAKLWFREES